MLKLIQFTLLVTEGLASQAFTEEKQSAINICNIQVVCLFTVLWIELRASCLLDKHSTTWLMPLLQ
jgi:hypothetical protein